MKHRLGFLMGGVALSLVAMFVLTVTGVSAAAVSGKKPIRIGFSMALSGALASAGKAALISMKICAEDFNAKGGVLGRPVELIYYDDHTKPADVPGIYTKLITVDKVDFIIGPYGTGVVASAIPIVMEHNMVMPSLFALDANRKFNYKHYYQFQPIGPDPYRDVVRGFFEVAAAQTPKPKTVALLVVDSEFGVNAREGAEEIAKEKGFEIIFNKKYPPTTVDFTPLMNSVKASNADMVYMCTYPPETVGTIRAAKEIKLKTKIFGGALIGAANTSIQTDLGKDINGVVTGNVFWAPEPTMNFPGMHEFLKKYQGVAVKEGVDPLGYYLPPFAYACVQTLLQAIEATKSLNQEKVSEYFRTQEHNTVVGKIKFGAMGEWATSRSLTYQFQNIKGNNVSDFAGAGKMVVLHPKEFQSGKLIYPFQGWQ